jgi:hypothetical protein
MASIRVFTFGVGLWRGSSLLLFEATRAVETARGFAPPLLADAAQHDPNGTRPCDGTSFEPIDASRSTVLAAAPARGRADDRALADQAGQRLLELALDRSARDQRVISCCPCWVNQPDCRRHKVADRLLAAARQAGLDVEIVEWPGGEPRDVTVHVRPEEVDRVRHGALSLEAPLPLSELAGLPWASVVRARSGEREAAFMSGPAQPTHGTLMLPVYASVDPHVDVAVLATEMRRDFRLSPRAAAP